MRRLIAEDKIAKIFCVMAGLLFLLLFGLSISSTWVNEWDLADEFLFQQKDSVLTNVLWLAFSMIVCGLLYCIGKRIPVPGSMDMLALLVSIVACLFSFYWVGASDTAPGGDQHAIFYFAEAFSYGEYDSLERGGYLGGYSHQLGLLTFVRILYRLFGVGEYVPFQYFNALMIPVLIFSGYGIVKCLTKDGKAAKCFYLLLCLTCVPVYCYVPFAYGEISSTALVMLAAWMFLECLEKLSIGKLGIMSLALGLAVQLRRNTLIFIIAFLIVVLVKLLQKVNWQNVIILVGVLFGAIVLQVCVDSLYAELIPPDSHPIPAITYVAMGVNDDKINAGWHNNYDVDSFAANEYDVERTTDAAVKYIKDFKKKCQQNPGYALDFYYRKVSAQWNAPMYQSLAMNNNIGEEQSGFAKNAYFGKLREGMEAVMNIYQLIIYGAVFVSLLWSWKHWQGVEKYLLLIAVFGGFLFSILWEAKTRYVFPYYVVMLPYAAVGLAVLVKALYRKCNVENREISEIKDEA